MQTDNLGNIYQANAVEQGQVLITDPSGNRLGTIDLPQIGGEPRPRICTSNVAFGDANGKELYISSCTHLFRVRLKVSGLRDKPSGSCLLIRLGFHDLPLAEGDHEGLQGRPFGSNGISRNQP